MVAAEVEKDAVILTHDPEFEFTKLIVRVEWLQRVD